ncbi:MAG: SDR family oxidoreductase [Desulfobacterales bacterium]|nr:SDR family oxidoreductase [Desulfobacterales bacterium]
MRNKIAVVTGGSEGIGKAVATGLAKEGAKVAISGRRADPLTEVAEKIRGQTAGDVLAIAGDMTGRNDVRRFTDTVLEKWGTVHILVNNVGCAVKALFEELTDENWRSSMEANLYSAIFCTERVLPTMRKQGWGRIINLAAVSAKQPSTHLMASNAAKSALLGFSKTLAREVAADNILVNCVCPGRVLSAQVLELFSETERSAIAEAQIPLKRFGIPEEVADLVVFLSSERSSYITGTVIPVDGGITQGLY